MTEKDFINRYVHAERKYYSEEECAPLRSMTLKEGFKKAAVRAFINRRLTLKKAEEDIILFFKLLSLCYSGYDYFSAKSDFSKMEKKMLDLIRNKKKISTRFLASNLISNLQNVIVDAHFRIISPKGYHILCSHPSPYFTELILEETEEGYRVIRGVSRMPIGTILFPDAVTDYLFPTLPGPDGKCRYLVGIITEQKRKTLTIGDVKLKLHRARLNRFRDKKEKKIIKLSDMAVFKDRTYRLNEDPLSYYDIGASLRAEATVIWDLRNNEGGNSRYPESFIKGLNDYGYWQCDCAVLQNPVFDTKQKERYYDIYRAQPYNLEQASYQGQLLVLTNKKVASSGEAAVLFSFSVPKSLRIGTATSGCGTFGDTRAYVLKNSKIIVSFGYKIFFNKLQREGYGIKPDYWLDEDNGLSAFRRWYRNYRKQAEK